MKKILGQSKRRTEFQFSVFKTEKGFTLMELLIVVAIIGILSTLLLANFIGVRQRARDGKRKSDVSQIQSALEQYRADQGVYPDTNSFPSCGNALLSPDISSTYMQKMPCDPLGDSYYNNGGYYYTSTGNTYTLAACLENQSDSGGTSTSPGGSGCPSAYYYVVNNP